MELLKIKVRFHLIFSFFPDSARLWTIHGIWPTSNHKIGPLFCNRTDKFDPEKIRPLLPELRSKCTDVRVGGDEFNFWKHEWEKHGTCAEQLPRYFKFIVHKAQAILTFRPRY